jgi:hypothetical protein
MREVTVPFYLQRYSGEPWARTSLDIDLQPCDAV